jgi:hypothetical protein
MLERIVYISMASQAQTAETVDGILQVARARNAALDITGLLIGGGRWWLQLLEGNRSDLDPVWQSIRKDPRHRHVVLVQRRPLRHRSFPDWSMKFRRDPDAAFMASVDELTGGISDPRLKDQVLRFSKVFVGAAQQHGRPISA